MSDAGGDLTVAAAHGGAAGSGANRRALRARATINYRDAVDWSNIALSSDSEDGGKRKERKRNRGGGRGGAGPASSGGAPAPTRAPRSIVPQPVSS